MSQKINSKLLHDYTVIKDQIAKYESDLEAIKSDIIADFRKNGIEKIEDPALGSFTLSKRITYSYSKKVEKLQDEVKALKVAEEQKGTAKVKSETQFILYKQPKVE